MRRNNGFIDVNQMLHEIGIEDTSFASLRQNNKIRITKDLISTQKAILGFGFSFDYRDKTYFYKYNHNIQNVYNELVAEELAYDFGIDCIHYDLAKLNGLEGVVSENYKNPDFNYQSGEELLKPYYNRGSGSNNLETIWNALEIKYQDNPNKRQIIARLMNQLVNIFIFDIVSCNYDRHTENWEFMTSKEEDRIGPIYDNERVLTVTQEDAVVALTVYEEYHGFLKNELIKFQRTSSREFSNLIKDKLWIIRQENLEKVFQRIEIKTEYPMPTSSKLYYLNEYQKHLEMLETILKELEENNHERKNR